VGPQPLEQRWRPKNLTGAAGNAGQGIGCNRSRHVGAQSDLGGEPGNERTSARQRNSALEKVGRNVGRSRFQYRANAAHDAFDSLGHRFADELLGHFAPTRRTRIEVDAVDDRGGTPRGTPRETKLQLERFCAERPNVEPASVQLRADRRLPRRPPAVRTS